MSSVHIDILLDILERDFRPACKILMSTYARDKFSIYYTRNPALIPYVKTSCLGYANFSINIVNKINTLQVQPKLASMSVLMLKRLVVLAPTTNVYAQEPALKHSTLFDVCYGHQSNSTRAAPVRSDAIDELTRSLAPSPIGSDDEDFLGASNRIGLVVHKAEAGYAARSNNLHSYLDLNMRVSMC